MPAASRLVARVLPVGVPTVGAALFPRVVLPAQALRSAQTVARSRVSEAAPLGPHVDQREFATAFPASDRPANPIDRDWRRRSPGSRRRSPNTVARSRSMCRRTRQRGTVPRRSERRMSRRRRTDLRNRPRTLGLPWRTSARRRARGPGSLAAAQRRVRSPARLGQAPWRGGGGLRRSSRLPNHGGLLQACRPARGVAQWRHRAGGRPTTATAMTTARAASAESKAQPRTRSRRSTSPVRSGCRGAWRNGSAKRPSLLSCPGLPSGACPPASPSEVRVELLRERSAAYRSHRPLHPPTSEKIFTHAESSRPDGREQRQVTRRASRRAAERPLDSPQAKTLMLRRRRDGRGLEVSERIA